ncbi:MAG: hypothetical protein JW864_13755 [Spirochaetes bacterium]|nr:hypothetical protein [Spirochaetota bacterium]
MKKVNAQVDSYKDFVKPFYTEKDPGHDFKHIERITDHLKLLSRDISEEIRLERLYFLACFHGLIEPLSSNVNFRKTVDKFLKSLEWTDDEIEEGIKSLNRHLETPETVEEKIVHDANNLEILGAFGIAKVFTTGGVKGLHIDETLDLFENEYLNKMDFYTPAGKELAKSRMTFTTKFIAQLRKELD